MVKDMKNIQKLPHMAACLELSVLIVWPALGNRSGSLFGAFWANFLAWLAQKSCFWHSFVRKGHKNLTKTNENLGKWFL